MPATAQHGLRATAHHISDLVFERLTGIPGAFSTRIAYVSVEGQPPAQRYRLVVADADGFDPHTVAESTEPLMSPAWSPDGQNLAYVSFEGKASAIYVQRLATGERRRVSARAGINGAPAWSPDGTRLALTLSRDGNLDIYTLELATQALTRLTSNDAIDTEPRVDADGESSVLHVGPRRQRTDLPRGLADSAHDVQRVTYTNGYNARPRVSPDGSALAHGDPGPRAYRIALMDLKSRSLRVLTNGRQDESPSFAPNGAIIVYATRGRAVGVRSRWCRRDGRYQQRLSADGATCGNPRGRRIRSADD